MDIKDIKEKKNVAQAEITVMLQKLEEETGCVVQNLEIERVRTIPGSVLAAVWIRMELP